MFEDKEKLLDKIRKLLALGESPNEHEASSAIAKAQELLEKYNLTMAEVGSKEDSEPELIECQVETDYSDWQANLYNCVAKSNYCTIIVTPSHNKIHVIGRYVNVVASIELAQWLVQQFDRIALSDVMRNYKTMLLEPYPHKNPESKKVYKEGFMRGLVKNVSDRLKSDIASRQTVTTNALVVRLQEEAYEFMRKLHPRTTTVSTNVRYSSGYTNGYNAGGQVSLTRPSHHVGEGALRLGSGS